MASSSSSSKLYDAFISHRGPDVKDTLATELYERLQERGCRAFLDREEIEGGESIPSAIHSAICSSVVQIAIFSKRYAESSWCLDELVLMLEQTATLFIPVFYDVHPWELRQIENEKSQYAAAFSNYQRKARNLDKLDKWKSSLASAADISGYERSQHQDNLCEKIASRALQEMKKRIHLPVAKYPVALDEIVQDFENSCSKVKIAGIFGLGGSGKTTLAKELFNRKRSSYDASCFLSDVRESHANRDLQSLQSKLLKDLLHENRKFMNVDEGKGELEYSLRRAKHLHFLVILDDIDHRDQLEALLPQAMVSSDSLVIITTRDQSVLTDADIRYRMKELNRIHGKDLFCRHAFGGRDPPIVYKNLVESFVEFCGGLPLSLKVLGAHVYRRDKYYWELELEKVKKIQPKDIMQKLKISFDGLDREEKQIFIDIACFFDKRIIRDLPKKAISIWQACDWNAECAVQALQDKCLLEVRSILMQTRDGGFFDSFVMHDHLRDLGRQMADDLDPPRLWRPYILRSMEEKGFKQILAETKGRCFHSFKDSSLQTVITYFIGSSNDSAETDLLWLEIDNFSGNLKKIPSWVPVRKLYCLSVRKMEELWSTDTQAIFELRKLQISDSPSLQKLPDLIGKLGHLEELEIRRSTEKTDIASFVQSLRQLGNLRLLKFSMEYDSYSGNLDLSKGRDSTNMEASTSSCMSSLETIEFDYLANISNLLISGEICPRLRSLKVVGNLNEMDLQQLDRLNTLEVCRCYQLETVSGLSSLPGLQFLRVLNCGKLETLSGLSSLTGLQVFEAEECERLKSLPTLAHLRHLERIRIFECHQLQSVEGIEELHRLKSLEIEVPHNGFTWLRNCIYGLRRLPSEYTILVGKSMDKASSRLNVNLFSEVIGVQAVSEIEKGEYKLEMRSSSSAITIHALLVKIGSFTFPCMEVQSVATQTHFLPLGIELMIAVIQTPDSSNEVRIVNVPIKKGFVARVNEGDEGKALIILQRIVDRLYKESVVQKLAAHDIIKRKRKQRY